MTKVTNQTTCRCDLFQFLLDEYRKQSRDGLAWEGIVRNRFYNCLGLIRRQFPNCGASKTRKHWSSDLLLLFINLQAWQHRSKIDQSWQTKAKRKTKTISSVHSTGIKNQNMEWEIYLIPNTYLKHKTNVLHWHHRPVFQPRNMCGSKYVPAINKSHSRQYNPQKSEAFHYFLKSLISKC